MLELQAVWIGPLEPPEERRRDVVGIRGVFASAAGRAIGRIVVRWLPWLPWRVRWEFRAEEGPDGAVVFVGRRAGWSPRDWNVYEADGKLVALVRGVYVLAPDGRAVGQRDPAGMSAADGAVLGKWQYDGAGVRIEFHERTTGEPFVRMAIVVAALIDD